MKIAVIGSGAWGTALAIRLCKNGHDVTMWTHSPEKARWMQHSRRCPRLPKAELPAGMNITADITCVSGCSLVVMATPSYPIRDVSRRLAPHLDPETVMVTVTKGIENGTLMRMSQVVEEETGHPVVVLTGPSHAEEVAFDVPTGLLSACADPALAELVQDAFMSNTLRVYTGTDPIGAEIGGAMKNVIALCAGVVDGLGCGDNTKAMLMTRGLTEMARLGVSMGAHRDTFAGLSGVGDLIVTCTSMHSRNRRAGILIGQGLSVEDAMKEVGAVVEGYYAARSAWGLCQKQGVEMPILEATYHALYENLTAREAMHMLMVRHRKPEEDMGWMM